MELVLVLGVVVLGVVVLGVAAAGVAAAIVLARTRPARTRHPDVGQDRTQGGTRHLPAEGAGALERASGPLALEPPRTRHRVRVEEEQHARAQRDRARFAQAGTSGPLFDYALDADQQGEAHRGLFAVLDLETTGLRPEEGDRVVEVAVALVRPDGTVVDEFATLVHPGRNGLAGAVDTGPVHIHGISPDDVGRAPTFAQVAPELLRRLDGAVVVAHNASFEERFLAQEFARAGYEDLRFRSVCTLLWARESMATPDHRLATVVAAAGIPFPAQHTALGDVRATAALWPSLLEARGGRVAFATPAPAPLPELASELGTGWQSLTRTP